MVTLSQRSDPTQQTVQRGPVGSVPTDGVDFLSRAIFSTVVTHLRQRDERKGYYQMMALECRNICKESIIMKPGE